tara:strand:- start:78 stop:551 length:474 start_codon:yes stop_codon:yes gene_type:complete
MIDANTIKRIQTAILTAVETDSYKWSDEMEQTYPEWKGSRIFKRQGNQHMRKVIFGYDNPEATKLEEGSPARPVAGSYVQQVKTHNRRSKDGVKRIRSHQRFYKGHVPIQLSNGQWRMVSQIPELKAKKPINKTAMKRYTGKVMEKLIADAIKKDFK